MRKTVRCVDCVGKDRFPYAPTHIQPARFLSMFPEYFAAVVVARSSVKNAEVHTYVLTYVILSWLG